MQSSDNRKRLFSPCGVWSDSLALGGFSASWANEMRCDRVQDRKSSLFIMEEALKNTIGRQIGRIFNAMFTWCLCDRDTYAKAILTMGNRDIRLCLRQRWNVTMPCLKKYLRVCAFARDMIIQRGKSVVDCNRSQFRFKIWLSVNRSFWSFVRCCQSTLEHAFLPAGHAAVRR